MKRCRRGVTSLVRAMDTVDRLVMIPLAAIALLGITCLVSADAVVRYVNDSSIPYVSEYTGKILMPMVVFCAISSVAAARGNVSVDLVIRHLGPTARRLLTVLFDIVGAVILAGFAMQFLERYRDVRGDRTINFAIPEEYTFAIIGLGCFWGSVRLLLCAAAGAVNSSVSRAEDVGDQAHARSFSL